jgi:hypothetical protein
MQSPALLFCEKSTVVPAPRAGQIVPQIPSKMDERAYSPDLDLRRT